MIDLPELSDYRLNPLDVCLCRLLHLRDGASLRQKQREREAAKQKQGESTPSDGWLCQFAVRMKYLIPNQRETQSPVDVTLGVSCGDKLKNEM
ncbi:unnamed protein product [Clonostachys rhizophaga]|uniref:Uncharacterized protein n=1 Tax=Clonostachys rhizophaga TaxID=160324 RepID=A0A9N9YLN2_9HYPO|nr:unnamed protein product [Clonostachys rhizophaga]